MRKLVRWCLVSILLVGCFPNQEKTKLHVFYAKTCQTCERLEKEFLPIVIEDQRLEVMLHDIDEKASQDLYQTLLNEFNISKDSSLWEQMSVPFIVLDKQFASIGYNEEMKELYLRLINDCLNDTMGTEEIASGIWLYQ